MFFGVPGLKRTLSTFFVSILLGMTLSCGYNNNSNTQSSQSKLTHRVFVSNPLHPTSGGGGAPALEIIDDSKDVLSPFLVSLSGAGPDAGLMAVSPKKDRTLVFSPSSNSLGIVDNTTESAIGSVALLGPTESIFISEDDITAFVAVPGALVSGQPTAGAVERINISTGAVTATIPIPGAHFLIPNPAGNQIMVISDSADAVTMLAPSLIDSGNPLTAVTGSFDRPTWAVFDSGGSTAFIINCGQECGGLMPASVAVIDMSQNPPAPLAAAPAPIAVTGGASIGFLNGSSLYLAGTAPGSNCASASPATSATTCGRFTVFDTSSLTLGGSVTITDGRHNRMEMGANGQLFIGARNCTNVNLPSDVRGCLSMVNTIGSISQASVTAAPDNGDVTGIAPIPSRNVVYVCEGGLFRIYDTTTDKLQSDQISIIGQPIDVKVVDF